MAITFNCPCGKGLRVGDEHAGKRVKCPACGAVAAVPSAEPKFEVVEDEPEERLAPKPAFKPAPVKAKAATRRDDDDEDDEDERPVAKKKKRDEEDEDKPKPKKIKARKRRDDDDDEYEHDRPRRRARARRSDPDAGKKVMYLIGGLVMVALGIAVTVLWWQSGPHTGRRPYSGYILGACLVVVGLGTAAKGITGNFDD